MNDARRDGDDDQHDGRPKHDFLSLNGRNARSGKQKEPGKDAKTDKDTDDKDDNDDKDDKDGPKGDEGKGDGEKGAAHEDKPRSRLPLIIVGIILVIAIIGGIVYWLMTRGLETTDDGYTEGNAVSMAPKISGYVTQLNITDNSVVHAGDVLLVIDQRDYITARDQAQANLALAQAQLATAQTDLEVTRVRAPATLAQAQAQLQQAQANQAQARRESQRQHAVDPRATTQTNVDQATAQFQSNSAQVKSAEAQVQVAALVRQTIETAEDTVHQREAQVRQAQANLEQAEVNLSYTVIRAPQDGHITMRNVNRGSFAQAGQQVFYIVTTELWVTANFKETQLNHMRPGQGVDISVDAYPDLKLHGHVDSIQAGSGARFTTFPAENATGNFVKIVRRVPVKIIVDSGYDKTQGLPLGLSVVPTVTVR